MERVFYSLHSRVADGALRHTSRRTRGLLEHGALVVAVCGFCIVLMAHRAFVFRGNHRIILSHDGATTATATGTGIVGTGGGSIPTLCLPSIPGFDPHVDVTHIVLLPSTTTSKSTTTTTTTTNTVEGDDTQLPHTPQQSFVFTERPRGKNDESACDDIPSMSDPNRGRPESCSDEDHDALWDYSNEIIVSYARTKGFLLLPPSVRIQHGISSQYVAVSPTDTTCFGEPFLQTIVFRIVGPETVIMNWLLALHHDHNDWNNHNHNNNNNDDHHRGGFLYNHRTKDLMDLDHLASGFYFLLPKPITTSSPGASSSMGPIMKNENPSGDEKDVIEGTIPQDVFYYGSSSWSPRYFLFKLGVFLTSVFLFFITTTLVSFTLRETQDRMLEFTFLLQAHIRSRLPFAQLVVTHVVENLVFVPNMVGMIFFLNEFYGGDKFLSLMILSVVWVCEVFSVVSMRTVQGIHFFPRTFFLYFVLFHSYFFSCPFGFSYLSLASTLCFILHSMLFFWNRYELPALVSGLVSRDTPRAAERGSPAAMMIPPPPPQQLQQHSTNYHTMQRTMVVEDNHEDPGPIQTFPSMSSLGRGSLSRATSNNVLFTNNGEEGDDSDSYMFFMNGEVVMRRDGHNNRSRPSSPSSSSIVSQLGAPLIEGSHSGEGSTVYPTSSAVTAATDAAAAAITGEMHPLGRGRSTRISSPTTTTTSTTTSQWPAATEETFIENDTSSPPLTTISTARLHPIDDDESSNGLAFSLLNFRSSSS